MNEKIKCECEIEGILNPINSFMYDEVTELPFVTHKPNKCKCINDLKEYIRNGKRVWLCSCCCLSSDKEVLKQKQKLTSTEKGKETRE